MHGYAAVFTADFTSSTKRAGWTGTRSGGNCSPPRDPSICNRTVRSSPTRRRTS